MQGLRSVRTGPSRVVVIHYVRNDSTKSTTFEFHLENESMWDDDHEESGAYLR